MIPQKTLVLSLVVFSLLVTSHNAFSGQKMQQVTHGDDLDRSLSANQSLLMRFQKEREQLLRNKTKDREQYLLKNKIKILENKINFLQSQLKYTKKKTKAPIILEWRPYAKPETRRRIFIAKVVKKVKMQPSANAELRQIAQMFRLPRKINWLPFAKTSERNASATLPLPRKINMKGPAKAEDRKVPQEFLKAVRPIATMPTLKLTPQKNAKTGRDWKNMSKADKEIYILSLMGNLSRHDIFLEKSYRFYIQTLDNKLEANPSLQNESIHNMLLASAYENEPECRPDIDRFLS